ncbi:MAG: hypothetical protein HYV08_06205 [Deltaproteobacteria bacterium]|nr:hypothetical protein [Deltaproteobacteria bacterium]
MRKTTRGIVAGLGLGFTVLAGLPGSARQVLAQVEEATIKIQGTMTCVL